MIASGARVFHYGYVRSPLTSRDEAPRQGSEGAPDAWLELDVLKLHPRGDPTLPLSGVFATRSPDRPNPIGLHRVRVVERTRNRIKVGPLEAIDGTPIVDIKPVLPIDDD